MNISWNLIENYTDIKYEKGKADASGITRITINRPEVRNAFRPKTIKELKDAFEKAKSNKDWRANAAYELELLEKGK